jgi:hypothetical protein
MRIDEIDLVGDLLLRGSTGSQGQVITYNSYGTLSWGAASGGGSSGSTQSYVKTVGLRYVLCETVNTNNPAADAITNGTNLGAAYSLAKTLNVGTKSPTNRVAVLLMPGRYNTNTLTLDTSYIDLIGVSSNALNTHLCSTSNYVLSYGNTVDSALQNVTFGTASILGLTGYGNNFLRWKNVVVTGKCFTDNAYYLTNNFGLSNVFGEFNKIVLKEDAYFAITKGTVSGTFENITSVDGYSAFCCYGVLSGTFSNILLKNTPSTEIFYAVEGMKGNYKDITIRNAPSSVSSVFNSNKNMNINVENFDFSGDPSYLFFAGVNLYGTFKNLNITYDTAPSGSTMIFQAFNYLDINLKNLEIAPHFSYNSIFGANGTVSGTYENLSLNGECVSYIFQTSTRDINVEIRNMTARTNGLSQVLFAGGKINSILDKIDVNSCSDFASSTVNLVGTFSNINVGAVSNNFFYSSGNLDGSFENIYAKVETTGFHSVGGALEGSYKNIEFAFSDAQGETLFTSDYGINGNFENILIRTGTTFFRVTDIGSVIGNFKKIRVMYKPGSYAQYPTVFKCDTAGIDLTMDDVIIRSAAYAFRAFSTITGTYSNITIEDISADLFYSETDNVSGNYENIDIINRTNPLNASTYTFYGTNTLSGKFKKIKIPGLAIHAGASRPVFGGLDISGEYEDIIIDTGADIGSSFVSVGYSSAFSDDTGDPSTRIINAKFKNIYVNRVPYIFNVTEIFEGVVIDNCYAPDSRFGSLFRGKLLNSTIGNKNLDWILKVDFEDTAVVTLPPKGIIHNSKIVNNGLTYSINIVNFAEGAPFYPYTRITRTATNGGINPLLNLITPNYNVNNSRVR